ncbi:MAG: hypothetical protein H6838_11530 [Planctomycetes bacterium]|nr:hypothetical protein [Planctomycetota bacterium]
MRIDPVFLVAPKPAPKAVPTRRAFLMAGGAFAFGSMIGGACGYSLGVAQGAPVEATAEKGGGEELGSSGDAQLDELRRLAVKAPIEELIQKKLEFLGTMSDSYRDDLVLWQGVERLCTAALEQSIPDRRLTSRLLIQAIERACPASIRPRFEKKIPELRSVK